MLIVFDGIDGAGKSTQISLAGDWLSEQGQQVVCLTDPGSTELGQRLRRLLLERSDVPISMQAEMLMFMAARAQLVDELILPAIENNQIVLCDRFTISTAVYQGHAGGLSVDDIWAANQIATQGLLPHLTLLFDLPADVAFERLKSRHGIQLDKLESRGPAYFAKVREGFLFESKRWPTGVEVLDATRPVDEIQAKVQDFIGMMLKRNLQVRI